MSIPYNFEKITVSSAVKTLTPGTPPNGNVPTSAVMSIETDAIRMRYDATDPDATTGVRAGANSTVTINGEASIRALKMIRVTTDATVNVQYFY